MWFRPIHLSSIEVHINADRSQVFQFIATFGTQISGAETSSQVLSHEDNRLLVEFKTSIPVFFRMRKTFRTVERVTLHKPERLDFEEVEGPFAMRRESIFLHEEEGKTHLQYEADLRMRGWILGWLLGMLFVRPRLKRAVRDHFKEIKEKTEGKT